MLIGSALLQYIFIDDSFITYDKYLRSYRICVMFAGYEIDECEDMPRVTMYKRCTTIGCNNLNNKMTCLYKAIVDNLIRALHIANYRSWLKGGS